MSITEFNNIPCLCCDDYIYEPYILKFGHYKNKSIVEVYDEDIEYCKWLYNEPKLNKYEEIKDYLYFKFNNINITCLYCGKYCKYRNHLTKCGFNKFLNGYMQGFKSLALMLYNRKIEVRHILKANEYLGYEDYKYHIIKKYNPKLLFYKCLYLYSNVFYETHNIFNYDDDIIIENEEFIFEKIYKYIEKNRYNINQEELIKECFKSQRIQSRITIYGMEYLDFEY